MSVSPLTKRNLELFLRVLSPDSPFATSYDPCQCPIAIYLKKVCGWERVRVNRYSYTNIESGKEYKMPKWGNEFTRSIDLHPTKNVFLKRQVTPRECLEILRHKA